MLKVTATPTDTKSTHIQLFLWYGSKINIVQIKENVIFIPTVKLDQLPISVKSTQITGGEQKKKEMCNNQELWRAETGEKISVF